MLSVIRPYEPSDREACLEVLRSNLPEHFVPGDVVALGQFLDALPGPYFVAVDETGRIVGCGGIAQEQDRSTATLCWGIVAAAKQRSGVGSALLEHRLREFLPEHPEVMRVRVN